MLNLVFTDEFHKIQFHQHLTKFSQVNKSLTVCRNTEKGTLSPAVWFNKGTTHVLHYFCHYQCENINSLCFIFKIPLVANIF